MIKRLLIFIMSLTSAVIAGAQTFESIDSVAARVQNIILPDYIQAVSIQTDIGIAIGKKDRAIFGKQKYLVCFSAVFYDAEGYAVKNKEMRTLRRALYGIPVEWISFDGFTISSIGMDYIPLGALVTLLNGEKPKYNYVRR